jgi:anti-sigma-K factor RskA
MDRRGAGLHTLVGAYVMDAVPAADRADFERHLERCDQCREEVRGLREAAARLAGAAAVLPRPELRQQTLQAAARIRQLPPVLAEQPAGRLTGWLAWWRAAWAAGRSTVWPPGRSAVWLAGHGSRPVVPGSTWLARIAVLTAAVCAAAAIVLGVHLTSMQGTLTAAQRRDHAIAAVLSAADATTLTAKVSSGGTATVVMSHRAKALVFVAVQLRPLPPSQAYELWLMGSAGDVGVGMLPPARGGMSGPMVVSGLAPGERLGLTVEPSWGSSQPTSRQLVIVGLGG